MKTNLFTRLLDMFSPQSSAIAIEDEHQPQEAAQEKAMSQEEKSVLINQSTLEQIVKDTSIEVLPMLIENYLEESKLRTQNIVHAVSKGDVEALEFESHTLGSTSLAMGASALGQLARKIEALCLEGKSAEAIELCEKLPELSTQSQTALLEVQNQMI